MAVTIDMMLKNIGEFGHYQWFLTCLLGYCLLAVSAFNTMIVAFIAVEPDWKCVGGYMNNTVCRFNTTITLTSNEYKARCNMPRKAWTFVDDFTSIVTEYDLVCDNSILLSVAQSCFWAGMLPCLVIGGYLSDKYGRRIVIISGIYLAIIASLIIVFPKSLIVFIVFRIFIGFGGGLANSSSYPLVTEFTTGRYRPWIGNGYFLFWMFGLMILPLIAYFVRGWRMLLLTTVVCGVPSLLLTWLLPESPRWLMLNKKEKEAKNQLLKIAEMNKKLLPDGDLKRPVILEQQARFSQLFSSWRMAATTLICWDLWFTVALVYYGVSFSTGDLGGNRYLSFFFIGLVGAFSLFASLWAVHRFGRKKSVVVGLVITVIASVISVAIPSDRSPVNVGAQVAAAIVANFFISFSFGGMYLWTVELFPTVIRSIGMSTSSAFGRVGSFSASYIIWLIRIHAALPYGIMGAIALQAAVLALFLPETRGKATLETMDDIKEQEDQGVVERDDKTKNNENMESKM